MNDLLARLKERKLVQWGLAYVAGAWALLQVLDMVGERFGWADALLRGAFVVAGVGLCATLLLAWYHGERGEQRVTGTELLLLSLLLAIGGGLLWRFAPTPGESTPGAGVATTAGDEVPQKSVAVLPFVALSSGEDDGYFADGLTEEIINALTTLPDLLVTARTSAFSFKGKNTPVPEIARALGVAHMVEGSVRRAGNEARITAQLIRAEDGFHLWSQTYDRSLDDIFAAQADIAENVAHALGVLLDEQKRTRMADVGVRDIEAFLAFQRGLELYDNAHGDAPLVPTLMRANAEFRAAALRKPDFAQASFVQADLYTHILFGDAAGADPGMTPEEAVAAIDSTLTAAARHEIDRGQRLVIEAVRTFLSLDWHDLGEQIDQAYGFWDNCETGIWMDPMSVAFQRVEQTYARNIHRTRCDPLNALWWGSAMDNALILGGPEESLALGSQAETTLGGRPGYVSSSFINAYLAAGRIEEAEAVLRLETPVDTFDAIRVDAAAGRAEKWAAWRTSQEDDQNGGLGAAAVFGDRDEANRVAALVDGRPLGAAELARAAYLCLCGAPFDLSATPNFARQLEEGDLPWPPKSPIHWPLKGW